MSLLVIAYPTISKSDFERIQVYRRANDSRQFRVVEPHFTLVFAIENMAPAAFVQETRRQIVGTGPIAFELRTAMTGQDPSGKFFHEFLVPEKGRADIARLHDRLYAGLFSPYRRGDIAFIPHMTIGDSADPGQSKGRTDALNRAGVSIPGTIDALEAIEHKDGAVTTIERLPLPI